MPLDVISWGPPPPHSIRPFYHSLPLECQLSFAMAISLVWEKKSLVAALPPLYPPSPGWIGKTRFCQLDLLY